MTNFSKISITFSLFLAVSFTSCKNNEKNISEENTVENVLLEENNPTTDGLNSMVDDPENEGEKMLLGLVNQEGFKDQSHFPWMYEEFESYKPNPTKLQEIKTLIDGVTLKVFMGTWCEDSQREIPRLYKILHTIDYNLSSMEIAAVSHDKETPSGLEKGYDLEYVPTIIFLKNGKELNRIVEYTQGDTLEDDFITILKGEPYTPAYSE